MVCARCGAENPAGFRFCGGCGAELAAAVAEPREVRKTVSLLFCDVTGSTALGERLDPETLRRVMGRYFDEISAVVRRHGGTVEKFIGDAVMAVFGVPRLREDDALRAVRAAVEIRDRLPAVAEELGVSLSWRTGVNTGEVVVGSGQTLATGDGVNVAARLEQAAGPGEILIGADTFRLVQHVVDAQPVQPLSLKGKSAPVDAYRLRWVSTAALAERRDPLSVFVGRERELQLLEDAFTRAVEGPTCHLFTLLGTAGVGKSRLTLQFLQGLGDRARIVRGRCLHYGDGITFYPLVEVLEQLGPEGADALSLVAGGGAVLPNELFLGVRRTLERAAADRPLVVVLDDLHWAEPMLLDLVDHIADLSRSAPLLLLCLGRPELLEVRAGWAGGKLNATTVLLEPLPAAECSSLVATVAADLEPEVRDHVIRACEGNPLFAVEMTELAREGGDLGASPTIMAILAARLDQLAADERSVIERGAVEGKVFHAGAVRALAPDALRAEVDGHLVGLVRKDLIRPDQPVVADEDDAFRFRHLLIRDAAYDALPKRVRADLHEQYAAWLDEHAAGLFEADELVGWHLEKSIGYRDELGLPVSADVRARAGERLAAAAAAARRRRDNAAAAKLYTRALAALTATHPLRASALARRAELAMEAADYDHATALLDEADRAGRTPLAVAVRAQLLIMAAPHEAAAFIESELRPLVTDLDPETDAESLAHVRLALSQISWLGGDAAATSRELDHAVELANRIGDAGLRADALTRGSGAVMFGPAPIEEMRAAIRLREELEGGATVELGRCELRAHLARMEERYDEAMAEWDKAQALEGELGLPVLQAADASTAADIAISRRDFGAAVRILEAADATLEAIGERSFRSTVVAHLGNALLLAGRPDEAEERAIEAEEIGAADDLVNFAIGRSVRARARAARGDLGGAIDLGRSALDFAERTDFPLVRAKARAALAAALAAGGRTAEARTLLEEAITLVEAKGDRPVARDLREELAALPAAAVGASGGDAG